MSATETSYVSNLNHNLAHCLPPELFADIFCLCAVFGDEDDNGLSDDTTPAEEVARLAKRYLQNISQVCSYWREVALGTPALWSTIIADTTLWSECRVSSATLVDLVSLSLKRSGSHPLSLQIAVVDELEAATHLLELVSQHAARWKDVYFWGDLPSLRSLVLARGNLPLLEKLQISNQNEDEWEWEELGVFNVAPRLTDFIFTGIASNLPNVPWGQLKRFKFKNLFPNDLVDSLTLLHTLDDFSGDECELRLDIFEVPSSLELLPVVSNASALGLSLAVNIDPAPFPILGLILDCLTLPCLKTLGFISAADEPDLAWNHPNFIAFASRSPLHITLTTLELVRLMMTPDELVQILHLVPSLVRLVLEECADERHALIIDTVLLQLIRIEGHPLIPQLKFISLTSILAFTDAMFEGFIRSRILAARNEIAPFEVKIYWLPNRLRDLSPELLHYALALEAQGTLCFTAKEDPGSVSSTGAGGLLGGALLEEAFDGSPELA